MQEYKLTSMPTQLKNELKELNVDIIEEKFAKCKSWLLYSEEAIDELLSKHNVGFVVVDVADTGWETLWRNYLEDGWLTDNVYYTFDLTNSEKKYKDKRKVIKINPALAFGTGGHATTKLAARLLEEVAHSNTVLDIGTGSGILAILAAKYKAKRVFAFDLDAVAMKNALENVTYNKCNKLHLWAGEICSVNLNYEFDVVVANIISSVLLEIHPVVMAMNPKYVVYSGILKKESMEVLNKMITHDYEPELIIDMNEWCAVRFKRLS